MKFLKLLLVLLSVLLFATTANALLITPASTPQWTGIQTGQAQIDPVIADIMDDYGTALPELYKQDFGAASDSGPLASSYNTVFSSGSGGTITYVGGDIVGPTAFLLVKDGNQTPAWYLFNLTDLDPLGWNGTDTLELSGFWTSNGSISHVSLYGNGTPVPEPATMLLLGAGLIGLGAFGRRKLFKS